MILALQTPGATTHMMLADATGATLVAIEWDSARRLADELLSKLEAFLSQQGTSYSGLDGIIIFSGPGSFTSLRIGHTVVNALASQLGIPVVGAKGENWISEGVEALRAKPVGIIAMPEYGAEPNITRPKA